MELTHHRENAWNLKSAGMWKEEVLALKNNFRWLEVIIPHHPSIGSVNESLHATPWGHEKDWEYPEGQSCICTIPWESPTDGHGWGIGQRSEQKHRF